MPDDITGVIEGGSEVIGEPDIEIRAYAIAEGGSECIGVLTHGDSQIALSGIAEGGSELIHWIRPLTAGEELCLALTVREHPTVLRVLGCIDDDGEEGDCMEGGRYIRGDTVPVAVRFWNVDGTEAQPTTVTFRAYDKDENPLATHGVPLAQKNAAGEYYFDYTLPSVGTRVFVEMTGVVNGQPRTARKRLTLTFAR